MMVRRTKSTTAWKVNSLYGYIASMVSPSFSSWDMSRYRRKFPGVVKTHRLLLSTPTSLMAPSIPALDNESCLTISPRAIRDIIEHFPLAKGAKSDPQLVWTFGESEVEVKSLESSLNTKGQSPSIFQHCITLTVDRQSAVVNRTEYQCG